MQQSDRPDLIAKVLNGTIPMQGRMIHGRAGGKLWESAQAYDAHGRVRIILGRIQVDAGMADIGQAINAVDRSTLNNALLDELEKTPNVKLKFDHKLTGADFRNNKAWFEQRAVGVTGGPHNASNRLPEIEVSFDFLIGADGAHSATRYHMMKSARVDYQQEYIDALWCEFQIAATELKDFRISPNHLHIWPGTEFMFIALPSADRSFTCTLFAPAHYYDHLKSSPQILVESFDQHFPGVCPELISPEALVEQFTSNPHLPLISIKCAPHHFNSSVVILGDAAHAILPFYGQGLNAGLEDVRVLFSILDNHDVYDHSISSDARSVARHDALQAYTAQRCPDVHAINDLSKGNYLEMSKNVKTPLYKLRKTIEDMLECYFPRLGWRTQYSRVSFSIQRYSEVVSAVKHQGELLTYGAGLLAASSLAGIAALMFRFPGPLLRLQRLVRDI